MEKRIIDYRKIKVIVFDFDGTLIDSNRLKYAAFFRLFPANKFYTRIIKVVLKRSGEESRYIILKEIIEKVIRDKKLIVKNIGKTVVKLADRYNTLVVSGAKYCREKSGAQEALRYLNKRFHLYLNSVTPQKSLREIVRYRKMEPFFCKIFGYPGSKTSVLREIMHKESVTPAEVLLVGDGKSDRNAACKAGCCFFNVHKDNQVRDLVRNVKNAFKER